MELFESNQIKSAGDSNPQEVEMAVEFCNLVLAHCPSITLIDMIGFDQLSRDKSHQAILVKVLNAISRLDNSTENRLNTAKDGFKDATDAMKTALYEFYELKLSSNTFCKKA